MNFKLPLQTLVLLSFFSFSSCSDENSTDDDKTSSEPKLTEHYYFDGKLDGETFLIEKKYYEDYNDEKPFKIDHGGTLINCSNEPTEGIHSDCYTIYSSGIHVDKNIYPEESEKHNTAKIYFGRIDVDKRIFDNELSELKNFFKKNELKFRRDFGNDKKQGDFAFDFFPPNPDANNQFYYSTRFNDNSDYTASITSVKEIDDYFFIIEGTVADCKLYDLRDYSSANPSYKTLTDFKFRVEIKGDFNYNNYKDD